MKYKKPLVYVVILTFNGKKNLEYCLPSLKKTDYPNYKAILVDNGSNDGSSEFTKKHFPDIHIIQNKKNKYWGPGNNQGIRLAIKDKARYVVLINDDMLLDKRWLTYAVDVCENDSRIGFIGFDLIDAMAYGNVEEFKKRSRSFKYINLKKAKQVTGCSLFSPVSLYENIGLFDERFTLYSEESDLARRARKAGYHFIDINVPLFHAGMATSRKIRLKASFFQMYSLMRCTIKNDPFIEIIKTFLFLINSSFNPFKKTKGDMFLERLRPMNPFFNLVIFVPAMLKVLITLPEMLCTKYKDYKRIRYTRSLLGSN